MYEKEFEKAVEAAKKGGEVILHCYNKDYEVQEKSEDHPITIADRKANEAIHSVLQGAFPGDGWLSEETKDTEERLIKRRVWIVDPLDGTKEFIAKIKEFAVSIALVVDHQPVVGVIYNPGTDELFAAKQFEGAFLNNKPIKTTREKDLKKARILASRSELKRNEWEPYEGKFTIVPSGGMAFKMSQVARGEADGSFSLQPKTEWDFAAGTLLIQEAGGVVTQMDGHPFIFNKKNPRAPGIIYGNPHVHRQLAEMVKK